MLGLAPLQIALASLAVGAGALVQGAVGFGSALIAAPLLALIDPRFVPGPIVLALFVLTVMVAVRERAALDLRGVAWAVAGRVPGTGLGIALLLALPGDRLAPVFATVVLLAVALVASGVHLRPSRTTLICAGIVSGVMGTVSSIGGPPVALVFHRASGPTLRGTLSGYFIFSTSITIAALVAAGELDLRGAGLGALLLPGVLLGFLASRGARRVLDRGYTRPAVLAIASAAALGVLLRTIV